MSHVINIQEPDDMVAEAFAQAEEPPLIDIQSAQLWNAIKQVLITGERKFSIRDGLYAVELHAVKITIPVDHQPGES